MHNRRAEITLCNYEEIVTIFLNEEKMLMKLEQKQTGKPSWVLPASNAP